MEKLTRDARIETSHQVPGGFVTGAPLVILRIEGAVLLMAGVGAFAVYGESWWLFAVLFLVPDVFMLGYLINKRVGALMYNLGHSTVLPALCTAGGLLTSNHLLTSVSLIWLAHVGFDRVAGYGLKYPNDFKSTHLGTPFTKRKA